MELVDGCVTRVINPSKTRDPKTVGDMQNGFYFLLHMGITSSTLLITEYRSNLLDLHLISFKIIRREHL